jgi:hypothetical protein
MGTSSRPAAPAERASDRPLGPVAWAPRWGREGSSAAERPAQSLSEPLGPRATSSSPERAAQLLSESPITRDHCPAAERVAQRSSELLNRRAGRSTAEICAFARGWLESPSDGQNRARKAATSAGRRGSLAKVLNPRGKPRILSGRIKSRPEGQNLGREHEQGARNASVRHGETARPTERHTPNGHRPAPLLAGRL